MKGQITLEFTIIAGFMLIMFAALFFSLQERIIVMRDAQNVEVLGQVAGIVDNEVKLAAQVGPGYERNFTLPPNLNGEAYNVTIQQGYDVVVQFENLEYIAFLETHVQGNVQKGQNRMTCCHVPTGEPELNP